MFEGFIAEHEVEAEHDYGDGEDHEGFVVFDHGPSTTSGEPAHGLEEAECGTEVVRAEEDPCDTYRSVGDECEGDACGEGGPEG